MRKTLLSALACTALVGFAGAAVANPPAHPAEHPKDAEHKDDHHKDAEHKDAEHKDEHHEAGKDHADKQHHG